MAALVRHDAGAQAPQFVSAEVEPRADACEIARLCDALDSVNKRDNPRTARLLSAGCAKMAQKVTEEAGEVALEAVRHRPRAVIRESANLVYQLVVLWHACGITPRRCGARCGIAPTGSESRKNRQRQRRMACRLLATASDGGGDDFT
jgi:phosphoribosyl-ATP pyrophosphohydrolase